MHLGPELSWPSDAALIFRGDEQLLPTESGRLPAGESARIARSPGREPRGEPGPWANQASCSFSTPLRVDENGDGCDACSFITLPRRSSAGPARCSRRRFGCSAAGNRPLD